MKKIIEQIRLHRIQCGKMLLAMKEIFDADKLKEKADEIKELRDELNKRRYILTGILFTLRETLSPDQLREVLKKAEMDEIELEDTLKALAFDDGGTDDSVHAE